VEFPDRSFDMVICNHVLEHIEDDDKAMSEIARVLKPQGLAIVTVPTRPDRIKTWEPPASMPIKEVEALCGWDHKRLYGLDLEDKLAKQGLYAATLWFNEALEEQYRFLKEPVFIASPDKDFVKHILKQFEHELAFESAFHSQQKDNIAFTVC
jgi:SAM-dependent methyltransferase